MPTTSDPDLLREFSEKRSETAFDALVRRHLDLVHSAAFRLTRDAHLAEDVTQAVFVALARHATEVARKVAHGAPLSAWLHVTTRNLASKLIRTESRRRARERESVTMNDLPSPDAEASWESIAPHLDRSLADLSESDRSVVLLRFFERKTAREIGGRLGIGEDAAQKRISRAMDRLRALLARRAPDVTASTLLAILGAFAVEQAPAALAAAVSDAALKAAQNVAPAALPAWFTRFASDLVMTKSQTAITGLFVAAIAIPLGLQRMEIRHVRAEAVAPALFAADVQIASPGETLDNPEPGASAEAEELARLQRRIEDLRARIAAEPKLIARPVPAASTHGLLLLARGQPVPVTNLVFVGDDTPEAAAQSMLTFMRDGNLEAAMGLWLLSPKDRAEWEDQIVNQSESRDEAIRHMQSEVTNLLSIELVEVQPIGARRSGVVLKRVSTTDTNTMTMTFGHAPSGWKQIP